MDAAAWLRHGVACLQLGPASTEASGVPGAQEAFDGARREGAAEDAVTVALLESVTLSVGEMLLVAGEEELGQQWLASGLPPDASDGERQGWARLRACGSLARAGQWEQANALHNAAVADVEEHGEDPGRLQAQLTILRTETELLSHELSLALASGALQPKAGSAGPAAMEPGAQGWNRWSRSQLGQDLWVLEQTGWKRGGYFVEFGATDGVLLSNSWLLEKKFGWNGICCEPNPRLFEQLQRNRDCQVSPACVYRTSGETMEFVLADAFGGLSQHGQDDSHKDKREAYAEAGELISVVTTSLMDLLQEMGAPKEIDYLSIDTEGSELAILEGIDWDRYRFHCITVEHNFTAQREEIAKQLIDQGYQRQEAQWDDWYVIGRA
jgi:FkbM family methyltransferase